VGLESLPSRKNTVEERAKLSGGRKRAREIWSNLEILYKRPPSNLDKIEVSSYGC